MRQDDGIGVVASATFAVRLPTDVIRPRRAGGLRVGMPGLSSRAVNGWWSILSASPWRRLRR